MISSNKNECPNCQSIGMSIIYDLKEIPVHSVLLHITRKEALEIPRGNLNLGYCYHCGFVSNISFNSELQNYHTHNYEATQAYSATFNRFHLNLAERLIKQYGLYGKRILEIGCGQGEFLELLCDLGKNSGIGFDPAYKPGDKDGSKNKNITFVKDYYTVQNANDYAADLICCKMTLEHIHDTYNFVKIIYDSLANQPNTIVFFQVPNAHRVFQEFAFWDIYYEHCSYFSYTSLIYLFNQFGFDIIQCAQEYDNQYLTIEAVRKKGIRKKNLDGKLELEKDITHFKLENQNLLNKWISLLDQLKEDGKKVVLWGGGSKAVAFLTTLNITREIEYVVDINPKKRETFLAGTGQKVVSSDFLQSYTPDLIIVMNPIYMDEIQKTLETIGVQSKLVPVNSPNL